MFDATIAMKENPAPCQVPLPNGTTRARISEDDVAKRRHCEDLLDEALKETFPASDPISVYLPSGDMAPARIAFIPLARAGKGDDAHPRKRRTDSNSQHFNAEHTQPIVV